MNPENVCVNFKYGYCKFGLRCRQRHVNIKCDIQECDSRNCERRHPYECRFYRKFKRCKFGDYCMYDHIDHIDPISEELKVMRAKLDVIEKELGKNSKEIKQVLERI